MVRTRLRAGRSPGQEATDAVEPLSRAGGGEAPPGPGGLGRSSRRRRPSGRPPPLPHPLQPTGVGWLTASVILVALSIVVFSGELRRPAVTVTVIDDDVVRWLSRLDQPGLRATMEVLAALGSWVAITACCGRCCWLC